MNFFDNILIPKALEIFGDPLPALIQVKLGAEQRLFENSSHWETILRKGSYIQHLAKEAGLVVRFDPRLHSFLCAFLFGLTPLPPVSGFRVCGNCGTVVTEKASTCPHCKGPSFVPSVSLPLFRDDFLIPVIQVPPQHYDRLRPLVDQSGIFLLQQDENLGRLCELLTEANMKPCDLPALCCTSTLELFGRMISKNEVMGCIGCVPDYFPYAAFAPMDRACTELSFDALTRKLAAFVLNGEEYALRSSFVAPVFGRVLPELPTAEDIYQYLLTHGHLSEAIQLKQNLTEDWADRTALNLTQELLDVLPPSERALLAEEDTVISKIYAIDAALFALQLAYIKHSDPISFYRVLIRNMDVSELGGKLDTPTWCETEVLNRLETMLGLPLTDLVKDAHELIEKLIELSEDMCFPNLGRSLLLLLDLDAMNYVDEVFRGHEKELHLIDWDWDSWWELRDGNTT